MDPRGIGSYVGGGRRGVTAPARGEEAAVVGVGAGRGGETGRGDWDGLQLFGPALGLGYLGSVEFMAKMS